MQNRNSGERIMLPHASLYDSGVTEPVSLGNKSNLGYKFWNIGKSRLLSDALSDYFDRNPRVFRNFMGPAYREGARFQRYTASWVIYQRGALAQTENLFDFLKWNQGVQPQWNKLAAALNGEMTSAEAMNGMLNVGGEKHDQQIWIGYYIPKNWRFELVSTFQKVDQRKIYM